MTTTTAPRIKARRIRRPAIEIPAASAPRLRECLATGQFVGIRAETLAGEKRTYCAHKPYIRHLVAIRVSEGWTGRRGNNAGANKARSEAQKAQLVFSEANADGIRSISGESRVFRVTYNGTTWTLGQSEYEIQRAEFAAQERAARAAELAGIVTTALAEKLESGDFPADFCAML